LTAACILMPMAPMPPDKAKREKGAGGPSLAAFETGDAVAWPAPGVEDGDG